MSVIKQKIHALYVALESAFGTDPSASGANYKFLKCIEASWSPTVDVIQRPGLVEDITTQQHAIGPRTGTLNFKLELKGSGTTPVDAQAAAAPESDQIMQAYFGTVVRGSSDTVQAGSSATVINVTAGSRFSKYMLVELTYSGKTYRRFVASISSNALTLDRALPGTPSNGSLVVASNRYTRANYGHQSLSFVGVRGALADQYVEYMFNGCKVDSLKITGITARGTAILDVQCTASDWSVAAKGSLPSSVLTGITAVKAPVIKGAPMAYGGTEYHVYSAEFDPSHTFNFQESTAGATFAGADGVNAGAELVDADPKGVLHAYSPTTPQTPFVPDMYGGTTRTIALASMNAEYSGWGIYIPVGQVGMVTQEDHNGMMGLNVPFFVRDNSTDPEYSVCLF